MTPSEKSDCKTLSRAAQKAVRETKTKLAPIRILAMALMLVVASAPGAAGELAFTIAYDGGHEVVVSQEGNTFSATEAGSTLSVTVAQDGTVTCKKGATVLATGKRGADKIELDEPSGRFYLWVRFKAEKTKVSFQVEEEEPYSFKVRDDKIKVCKGETVLGKVKYYPDSGKVKVKDKNEAEVAVSRDLGRLSAAPGVLLLPGLDRNKRNIVLLLLLASGK